MTKKRHRNTFRNLRSKAASALVLLCTLFISPAALAVDPPYQDDMRRLNEIMGSLYFLEPLCAQNAKDWRLHAAELIALDNPDDDRHARLIGAFNEGYEAYARVYRRCSDPAFVAMTRLLQEAEQTARSIHSRYAE